MEEKSPQQPTPIELAALGEDEYEVWASQTELPPSLLIALSTKGENRFKIIDPAAANAEVLSADHYLYIVAYLRECEYQKVRGRMRLEVNGDDD